MLQAHASKEAVGPSASLVEACEATCHESPVHL